MDNYFLKVLVVKLKFYVSLEGFLKKISKQSEITRTYLTQIENGKVNPSNWKNKENFLKNLNISLCEMFKDI